MKKNIFLSFPRCLLPSTVSSKVVFLLISCNSVAKTFTNNGLQPSCMTFCVPLQRKRIKRKELWHIITIMSIVASMNIITNITNTTMSIIMGE